MELAMATHSPIYPKRFALWPHILFATFLATAWPLAIVLSLVYFEDKEQCWGVIITASCFILAGVIAVWGMTREVLKLRRWHLLDWKILDAPPKEPGRYLVRKCKDDADILEILVREDGAAFKDGEKWSVYAWDHREYVRKP
jgi:hypothetical protein